MAQILTQNKDGLLFCGFRNAQRDCHAFTLPTMHIAAGSWPVTLSFGCHCHPASASPLHSMLAWQEGRGAALHGWRESGGDIAEGQLGTLWNAAQKPRQEMKGEERCREGKHCEVTFSAFPNPDDKANRSLPANFYPKEPSLLLVHPPTRNKNKGTVLRKADACNL